MSNPNLKSLLRRKKDLAALLARALSASGCLEDTSGDVLMGERIPDAAARLPLVLENETVGWISGDEQVEYKALLINYLLKQESEKKQLGAETLHLYKEINLIYSFAEKLSAATGVEAIARIALEEARQLIVFEEGTVVLTDAAWAGILLRPPNDFFRELAWNGKSEIIAAPLPDAQQLLLYASLKVGPKILGAILLRRPASPEFSAADLKLLITLAFQAAAAIESALAYEKSKTEALQEQREKLILEQALKHPFFKKVLAVIQANITNPDFNVERLSKTMNLSPSQLQRKIFALTERKPVQIIRDLRLQKAKELLRTTDLTVAEIAWQTGFNDPSYFTRLFTREMQVTPSEWKGTVGS